MGRPLRQAVGGVVYHVLNRRVLRLPLFEKKEDYFGDLWLSHGPAIKRTPMEVALGEALSPWPVERSRQWLRLVHQPQTAAEVQALRRSVVRKSPYGSPTWSSRTAARLGLESTARPAADREKLPRNHPDTSYEAGSVKWRF